ncbi:MAG: MsnO8 family LLM class oxidoreductase, partial [Salinisphaera sp.]|nr:MsnO8 family LLM class oxidoreductase [Salinisphaera sp.]
GRAPGSDPRASRALGAEAPEHFGQLFNHMLALSRGTLPRTHPVAGVTVMPDDVALPPIWILGSSGASAAAAGGAGMGYGFASHFSPAPPGPALERYRASFKPSAQFPEPHAILAVSVVCAETDEQAEYLAASVDLTMLRIEDNDFRPMVSAEDAHAYQYSDGERRKIEENRARYIVGGPQRVCECLAAMAAESGADELMLVCNLPDHSARLDAYRLIAGAAG